MFARISSNVFLRQSDGPCLRNEWPWRCAGRIPDAEEGAENQELVHKAQTQCISRRCSQSPAATMLECRVSEAAAVLRWP